MAAYSSDWQAYTWKNELQLQSERVGIHLREALDDEYDGPHSPLHMLERALCLSAFSVRRMVEKRLVTDAFAATAVSVRSFPFAANGRESPVFHRASGGSYYNYDLTRPTFVSLKPKSLADEIIHSSQLMALGGEETVEDGLLVVSDWHLDKRVLHLSLEEFDAFIQSVLRDQVGIAEDRWDAETGVVTSTRLR